MKIMVTGGSGFIGSHLIKKLIDNKVDFISISRTKSKKRYIHFADVFNLESIKKVISNYKPTVLIHLAWDVTHGKFWHDQINTNYYEASIDIFKVFLEQGGEKIIFAGSSAEYNVSNKKVSEDIEVDYEKLTLYGLCKRKVYDWLSKNTENYICIRIFGIFGHGDNKNKFIPYLLSCIQNNSIPIIENKSFVTDYIFVEDLADIIYSLINKNFTGALNIGASEPISNAVLYLKLKDILINKKIKNDIDINVFSPKSRIPDCTRLNNLGLRINFENGIIRFLN